MTARPSAAAEEMKDMIRKILASGRIVDALVAAAAGAYVVGFIVAVETALAKLVY